MSDMMTTQAGDAGAFRNFDLSRVPTPCFVVDEKAVERNLRILSEIGNRSGAHVLSALKAFSMFSLAPLKYSDSGFHTETLLLRTDQSGNELRFSFDGPSFVKKLKHIALMRLVP